MAGNGWNNKEGLPRPHTRAGRTECSSHAGARASCPGAPSKPGKVRLSPVHHPPHRMTRTPSPQAATRFAIPRTLMAGFVLAAVATLVIGLVNFRSAESRSEAVRAMDRTTLAMRQLNLFTQAIKDAETGQRGYLLTSDS